MKRVLGMLVLAGFSLTGLAADNRSVTAGPSAVSRLDEQGAARLATALANKNAAKLYDSAPFVESQGSLIFIHGHWQWEAIAGYGTGDLAATVTFAPDGSKADVTIQNLVLMNEAPNWP